MESDELIYIQSDYTYSWKSLLYFWKRRSTCSNNNNNNNDPFNTFGRLSLKLTGCHQVRLNRSSVCV